LVKVFQMVIVVMQPASSPWASKDPDMSAPWPELEVPVSKAAEKSSNFPQEVTLH
jgi:hypothetical protein